MGAGLVRAVVIIAKYQATTRQRQVAEQRARIAVAKLSAPRAATAGGTSAKRAAHAKAPPRKVPRYIAVDTVRDERSQGRKSVMIWDTKSEEIVGNNVYDVESTPPVLQSGRFEVYSAQYVATADF